MLASAIEKVERGAPAVDFHQRLDRAIATGNVGLVTALLRMYPSIPYYAPPERKNRTLCVAILAKTGLNKWPIVGALASMGYRLDLDNLVALTRAESCWVDWLSAYAPFEDRYEARVMILAYLTCRPQLFQYVMWESWFQAGYLPLFRESAALVPNP